MQIFLQIIIANTQSNFDIVKIKVGDIVKNEVLRSRKPKTQIAKDLERSRTWLDNILAQPEIELKYIMGIGKSIRYDFSKHFPQLNVGVVSNLVDAPEGSFDEMDNSELRSKLIEIQGKYISLLEDHVKILREIKSIS